VTIEVKDQYGTVLRTLNPAGGGTDGLNSVSWDGNDDSGSALPDGQYLFTIAATNASVEIVDYGTYNGDSGDVRVITGENTYIAMDADGSNIFSPAGKENIFEVMADLITALKNDDRTAIATQKSRIDEGRRQIGEVRSMKSPKLYQLQSSENYWSAYRNKLEQMLTDTEDVDLNVAVMGLKNLELAYQATIATAARIIQPGLINFLK
jgi:flagellar hook-associated protein 3 FlgL